ncbi:MAG: elongation factor P maturation arginine rhamnosyltransferase EarP [Gallionellaceae bacterium]
MSFTPKSCDIFCAVVDNYGDIGVSWRLARQLAHEHGVGVRLWVDDLHSFAKLCPEVDVDLNEQLCRGIEVRHWGKDFPEAIPADLVIEAFACKLPESYVEAMAVQECKAVWLNLEYLSAEDWVEGVHCLPSPHLRLPLDKYFFFPGFTDKTGGLLLEQDLLARRDEFQADAARQQVFWQSVGVPAREAGELRVSLFSYENAALSDLLQAWAQGETPIVCCVPEGRVLPQLAEFFAQESVKAGDVWQRGNLRVHVLPFVEQQRYDELLWACDVSFVRGEDSCVRAQWAAKPFVWHIYPQHDGVHMDKLHALSDLYGLGLPAMAQQANEALWLAWNGEGDVASAWRAFEMQQNVLKNHTRSWSGKLAGNSLALNLLDFSREFGRIRALKK